MGKGREREREREAILGEEGEKTVRKGFQMKEGGS